MKQLNSIILLSALLLSACSHNEEPSAQIHVPLIKECKEKVIDHLENPMWSNYEIKWDITEYGNVLATMHAPQLIGTLTVFSNNATEEDLQGVLNGALFKCYPTSNLVLAKNVLGKTVLAQLDLTDRIDSPEHYYFVLEGEELSIFFLDIENRSGK